MTAFYIKIMLRHGDSMKETFYHFVMKECRIEFSCVPVLFSTDTNVQLFQHAFVGKFFDLLQESKLLAAGEGGRGDMLVDHTHIRIYICALIHTRTYGPKKKKIQTHRYILSQQNLEKKDNRLCRIEKTI